MRLLFGVMIVIGIAGGRGDAMVASGEVTPQQPDRAPRRPVATVDGQGIGDFNRGIKEYSELHKRLESTLPPLPNDADPAAIEAHQRSLEKLLRTERRNAKQGDILTPAARRHLRGMLAKVLNGPDGASLKATIMDENPGKIALSVNSRYPDGIPVSTVPPQVLAVLPRLPEELEYRFIGNRLILLDVHAYTVVDYMDDAFRQ
jgi:hypothetical protein